MNIELNSIITCPKCNHQKEEEMPLNSCLFTYECEQCLTLINPKNTNECVFCSFGNISCPPMQENHMGHVYELAQL